jgi:chromosome segregation ATPase
MAKKDDLLLDEDAPKKTLEERQAELDRAKRETAAVQTQRDQALGMLEAKKAELAALLKEIKAAGYDPRSLKQELSEKEKEFDALMASYWEDLQAAKDALEEFEQQKKKEQ